MWQKNYYAMCHNLGPSLTIIIDNGNQYFKKIRSKNCHSATFQILMNGWKLVTSTWHYGCSCSAIA